MHVLVTHHTYRKFCERCVTITPMIGIDFYNNKKDNIALLPAYNTLNSLETQFTHVHLQRHDATYLHHQHHKAKITNGRPRPCQAHTAMQMHPTNLCSTTHHHTPPQLVGNYDRPSCTTVPVWALRPHTTTNTPRLKFTNNRPRPHPPHTTPQMHPTNMSNAAHHHTPP